MLAVSLPIVVPQSIAESCDKSQASSDSFGNDGSEYEVVHEASQENRASSQLEVSYSGSMVAHCPASKGEHDCWRMPLMDRFKLPNLLGRLRSIKDGTWEKRSDDSLVIPATHSTSTTTSSTQLVEEMFASELPHPHRGSLNSSVLLSGARRRRCHHVVVVLEEPFGSRIAWCASVVWITTNCTALILLCLEHSVSERGLFDSSWGIATVMVNCVGTFEALLRIVCSPRRRRILGHTPNFIDVVCVLPFWIFRVSHLDVRSGWASLVLASRMELWFRLLKLSRYFGGWRLLFLAVTEAGPALMLPLVALILIMGFGACVILIAEEASKMNGERDDIVIVGFPDALRFCLLCIIAIDAGPFYDLELKSEHARVFVGALMMSGLVVFAMPMSIVGTCFCRVWFQRHRLLFVDAVRRRVERESLQDTKQKLEDHFNAFAKNGPTLGIAEFQQFVHSISPNMRAEVVLSIFGSFDQDQDGSVSFHEVHAAVFPEDADLEFLIGREAFAPELLSQTVDAEDNHRRSSYQSENDSEFDATSSQCSSRYLTSLENRLRSMERRHHEPSMLPPWCQMGLQHGMPSVHLMSPSPAPSISTSTSNFRPGISSSKRSSRRTSAESILVYPRRGSNLFSTSSISTMSVSGSRRASDSSNIPLSGVDGCLSSDRNQSLPCIKDDCDPDYQSNRRPSKDSNARRPEAMRRMSCDASTKSIARRMSSSDSTARNHLFGSPCVPVEETNLLGVGISANRLRPGRQSLGPQVTSSVPVLPGSPVVQDECVSSSITE